MENNEPKGIAFFSVKTGETRYAKLEAQVQAYINSSDLGINASRGQDFGWKLDPEWVKKVRAFRKNETKMEALTTKLGGQRPTTVQVLYAIYGEQLRAAEEVAEENENPFEEEYQREIAEKPRQKTKVEAQAPTPLDDLAQVDEADLEPSDEPASGQVEEVPTSDGKRPTKAATSKQKAQ